MADDSNAEMVTAYLDDALEPGDAESFERYLDESPDARREVEDLQKILSIVRELPDVQAPPDFYDNIAKKIRRRRGAAESSPVSLISLSTVKMVSAEGGQPGTKTSTLTTS